MFMIKMIRNSKKIFKAADMLSHMRECNGNILNHVHTAYYSMGIYSLFFILHKLRKFKCLDF